MIAIQKGREPDGLRQLRQRAIAASLSPKEAYNTLKNPLKIQVRNSLMKEQGQLCAYCMCRIPRSDVDPGIAPISLEHVLPRNSDDGYDIGQGLDYNNLVAVCHGNRGAQGSRTILDLTCDAHKGNEEFRKINPCKPETLSSITYTLDGKIDATDPDVQYDLKLLNLNCLSAPIIGERRSALESLIIEIGQVPDKDQDAYCSEVLEYFSSETDPKTPYVGILMWYLQSMVEAMNVR